jgi:hypothetical protein
MAPRDGRLRGSFQDCSAGAASDSRFGSPFVAFDRDDARVFRMGNSIVSFGVYAAIRHHIDQSGFF